MRLVVAIESTSFYSGTLCNIIHHTGTLIKFARPFCTQEHSTTPEVDVLQISTSAQFNIVEGTFIAAQLLLVDAHQKQSITYRALPFSSVHTSVFKPTYTSIG